MWECIGYKIGKKVKFQDHVREILALNGLPRGRSVKNKTEKVISS